MQLQSFIGIGASIFTATSLIPQLVKLCREKKPQELSYGMLIVLFVGLALHHCMNHFKKTLVCMRYLVKYFFTKLECCHK